MLRQRLDRVFFLTAKTLGRQLALDALQRLEEQCKSNHCARIASYVSLQPTASQLPLHVLKMAAKEKACNVDSYTLAKGF